MISYEECISDILNTGTKLLDSPTSLLMIALVFVIIFTHAEDMSAGWLADLVKHYPDNKLLQLIKQNFEKFIGIAIFASVLVDLPKTSGRLMAWVVTVAGVLIMPPYNAYQYALQALLIHAYFRVGLRKSRTVLILLGLLVIFIGHDWLGKFNPPFKDNKPSTKPKRFASYVDDYVEAKDQALSDLTVK